MNVANSKGLQPTSCPRGHPPCIQTHYLKSYQKHIASDDRLHTSMSLSFTVTGRAGSRQPNTMTFPSRNKKQKKIVKSLFVAPKGYKLLNLDLSQAELRFIAHESQDERMIEIFKNDEALRYSRL